MKIPRRIIILYQFVVTAVVCVSAMGQSVTCTVKVLDSQGTPVSGAEVVAYEDRINPLTQKDEPAVLCGPQQTGPDGNATLPFHFKRPRVMIVARKPGYALGWDLLFHTSSTPHVSIILDRPVVFAGRVVDDQARPVAGASVQAQPKTCKLDRLEQWPVIGPSSWMTVSTDAQGRFEFNCFGADVSTDFVVIPPASKTAFKFTPYYLSSCGYEAGENTCLTLPKRTVVEGRVVDEKNRGIGAASLIIQPDHRDKDFRVDYAPLLTETDEKGRFCFKDIPSGSHFLTALNTDVSKPWVDQSVILDTSDEKACEAIQIRLETGVLMEVVMQDESAQQPIESMVLIFSQAPVDPNLWWFDRMVETDGDGKARIMLPAGQCNVRYWDDRPYERRELEMPVLKKDKSQTIVFSLTRQKPITGRVNNPDGTPAQCTVKMTWSQTAQTDGDGAFECRYDSLREGMCLIARDEENNTAAVSPVGNPDDPAVLTLTPACTLKGTVVEPNGDPIPAARVELQFSGPGYLSDCCPEVLTDKEGRFEVKAIPSSLPEGCGFRISISTMNHGAENYQRLQVQEETDEFIELKPIQMSPANQTVDGFVIKADGTAAAGLPIFLQGTGQYHRSTVTDKEGRFQLRRLCEGKIRMQAGISSVETERGSTEAQAGDTEIKIILGQRLVHVSKTSLSNKTLPALEVFDFGDSKPHLRGQPVLVCFWDYTQRPSRHAVSQLAGTKQQLSKKNVAVVLIHATAMDEPAKQWLAEKDLPAHSGSIIKDAEQLRSQWGVQSLPWIILTNAENNVIAEGFSVNELENKLKGL
jgi:hypothetical protein